MKKFICVLLIVLCVCSFLGCADSTEESTDASFVLYGDNAKQIAKESAVVGNSLATRFGLTFYSIDWGVCEANPNEDGSWNVILKGNISGYTDEYKTDYMSSKKFIVTVDVHDDKTVSNVEVTYGSRFNRD